ncbi:MAG: 3-hydroxybutyryl-CoA dehydrogenase [Roseiarcus sp.]
MAFEIRKIGVIGAGQMGSGIAQVSALAGFDVVLNDLSEDRIEAAIARIDANLGRLVEREAISAADKKAALARIKAAADFAALSDADLVMEAAAENEEVKRKIFSSLCAYLKKDAIIATNTSSISITRLASITDRPSRFIGIHFMNPVPRMQLVELIRGIATEDETFQAARAYIEKLQKTVTVSEDFPAFIVNRILLPMINEAIYTLYEGVGSVDAIDTAMRLGANHPMGPLQLADFIGLDTCLSVMQVLHEGLADSKYRPCPLLVKYVEAGWLGRKTQRGFYDYRSGAPVPTR